MELEREKIQKLKRGELVGNICVYLCGVVLVLFIVGFTISRVYDMNALYLATVIVCPILLAISCGIAAYANIKFTGTIDKLLSNYIKETFIANASSLHPEKDSVTFYMNLNECVMTLRVNNYKDIITFDFTSFDKLSPIRKMTIFSLMETRLTVTYIKLFEKLGTLKSVNYYENDVNRNKHSGKPVYIIENGEPNKRAYRIYLKNKNI